MKVIITVYGKDRVGIIAAISAYLAEKNVNILNITQDLVQDYFSMMMITDMDGTDSLIATIQEDLSQMGEKLGVKIHAQQEEIFNKMHRI